MYTRPANAPSNLYEAFTYIGTVTAPSIDDLKLMVLLEAAGKVMYDDLASGHTDPLIQTMLVTNGHDEFKHAERISKAICKLTGENYPVPRLEENPYLAGWVKPQLTVELVSNLAKVKFNGESLYERWAKNCPNEEAAALFRLNGIEETRHGYRLQRVAEVLAGR